MGNKLSKTDIQTFQELYDKIVDNIWKYVDYILPDHEDFWIESWDFGANTIEISVDMRDRSDELIVNVDEFLEWCNKNI